MGCDARKETALIFFIPILLLLYTHTGILLLYDRCFNSKATLTNDRGVLFSREAVIYN